MALSPGQGVFDVLLVLLLSHLGTVRWTRPPGGHLTVFLLQKCTGRLGHCWAKATAWWSERRGQGSSVATLDSQSRTAGLE